MKIIDIQRFINKFKILTEAVTLPQIRRGILGKDREYPVIDDEKGWYEEHKSEILKTIEKVLNVDDKTLKKNLQKFDTWDYFTNDKPRKLKPKELLKSLKRNFISQVERSRNIEDKTSGIEEQYEMMKMRNGVEVYAVYTPIANRYLTHTKLWVQGCFRPGWCIASSTANNYWSFYHLYEANYPSVFIVAQKTENGYNPVKYQLKCNPHESDSFKNGEITLEEWVDEWRNPEQNGKEYDETSLFDTFNITIEDLEDTIIELVESKKAEGFSKKYGEEMLNLYTEKINSGDEDTKMEYLTKACKNGTFVNFCNKIDKEDKDYFLDELIRYDTLTEEEVQKMHIENNKKALSYLIKMKRCTDLSLRWANNYFDNNTVRRVYHSLPDEILSTDYFDGFNVRESIFENIKNVEGLTEEFVNYQIKNGNVNNTTLYCVQNDKELLKKCVESLIKNDKVDDDVLECAKNDKESLKMCVEFLIKNDKVDGYTLGYVEDDKDLFKKCLDFLIKNDKVDNWSLMFLGNDKKLLKTCVEILIKKGIFDYHALKYINDKALFEKCVDYLIKNGEVNGDVLEYVNDDKELFEKCLEFLIKNNKVDNETLEYVKDDKETLKMCVDYLIKNGSFENYALDSLKDDKELLKMCVEFLIKNDKIDSWTLKHLKNDKVTLTKCVDYLIKNDKVNNNTLYYVRNDKVSLTKCVDYLIKNNRVNYDTLNYLKDDKELLSKCRDYLNSKKTILNKTNPFRFRNGFLL